MPQDIVVIDSTGLATFMSCNRKFYFQHIQNLQPLEMEEYFDRGGLLHYMLATHYKLIRHNYNVGTDSRLKFIDYSRIIKICLHQGQMYSLRLDLQPEECQMVMDTYEEYAKYYENRCNWIPLQIEQPFAKLMYEDENLKIIYDGLVDLVTNKGVVDTKSSKRRGEPCTLSDQFIAYCWALNSNVLIVNKIGFQKTLTPAQKFERYTKNYPQPIIDEWVQRTIRIIRNRLYPGLQAPNKLYQDYNLTACDKYDSGNALCRYIQICGIDPELRDWKISKSYKIGKPWAPSSKLGDNK